MKLMHQEFLDDLLLLVDLFLLENVDVPPISEPSLRHWFIVDQWGGGGESRCSDRELLCLKFPARPIELCARHRS